MRLILQASLLQCSSWYGGEIARPTVLWTTQPAIHDDESEYRRRRRQRAKARNAEYRCSYSVRARDVHDVKGGHQTCSGQ